MAKNVFISFRFADGYKYKEELAKLFSEFEDTVDFSEDQDRSGLSDETIRRYLYGKLSRSSITIVILTPQAVNHQKNIWGQYYDWMYDEIRYSLEYRGYNRTNGLIAVYVPEAEKYILEKTSHYCDICKKTSSVINVKQFDNLVFKNMMNVKLNYKKNKCYNIYDANYDSFCSLISYEDFKNNFSEYIEIASEKRENRNKYNVKAHMQ